jgi:hypothetical protein
MPPAHSNQHATPTLRFHMGICPVLAGPRTFVRASDKPRTPRAPVVQLSYDDDHVTCAMFHAPDRGAPSSRSRSAMARSGPPRIMGGPQVRRRYPQSPTHSRPGQRRWPIIVVGQGNTWTHTATTSNTTLSVQRPNSNKTCNPGVRSKTSPACPPRTSPMSELHSIDCTADRRTAHNRSTTQHTSSVAILAHEATLDICSSLSQTVERLLCNPMPMSSTATANRHPPPATATANRCRRPHRLDHVGVHRQRLGGRRSILAKPVLAIPLSKLVV